MALPEGQAAGAGDFVLVRDGRCLPVIVEAGSGEALRRAAGDLAADLVRVAGAEAGGVGENPAEFCVLVGRVGAGGLIDQLLREGRLGARDLAGQWESTHIEVVDRPLPGVARALVWRAAMSAARFSDSMMCRVRSASRPGIGGRT